MRVLFSTYGTRGDVQPFVALAKALETRGHEVALCTPSGFREMVERHDIPYAPMENGLLELTEAVLHAPTAREKRRLFKGFGKLIRVALDDEWRAAQHHQPDLLVYHSKALGSHHIAEKLGIAECLAMPLPLTKTRAFPVPLIPNFELGGWFNAFSYHVVRLGSALWAGAVNDFRKSLGLPKISRFNDAMRRADGSLVPALYAYSEHLLPRPDDWPEEAHVTGAWFLDETHAWSPPAALEAFLDSGPPPVYVGFGSMGAAHAEARAALVLDALAACGERGVLAAGWGGLKVAKLPANVFALESAPHEWLFPRVKAVVHHGGAGSTMAGLRAGKPTVICPFFGDQPFWGHVVERAGVGPSPIPQSQLSAERLANRIRDALRPDIVHQAAAMGARIRSENGLERAVSLLEKEHASWTARTAPRAAEGRSPQEVPPPVR